MAATPCEISRTNVSKLSSFDPVRTLLMTDLLWHMPRLCMSSLYYQLFCVHSLHLLFYLSTQSCSSIASLTCVCICVDAFSMVMHPTVCMCTRLLPPLRHVHQLLIIHNATPTWHLYLRPSIHSFIHQAFIHSFILQLELSAVHVCSRFLFKEIQCFGLVVPLLC